MQEFRKIRAVAVAGAAMFFSGCFAYRPTSSITRIEGDLYSVTPSLRDCQQYGLIGDVPDTLRFTVTVNGGEIEGVKAADKASRPYEHYAEKLLEGVPADSAAGVKNVIIIVDPY